MGQAAPVEKDLTNRIGARWGRRKWNFVQCIVGGDGAAVCELDDSQR